MADLKIDCDCRKPKPGMLIKAAQDFNIDLKNSWMVGDGENDVKAGTAAGCKVALISDTGITKKIEDFGQDMVVSSLQQFVEKVIP